MKKLSQQINERLKIDKTVKGVKSLSELKKGDKLYYYWTYVNYSYAEDDDFVNNKIMTATVTRVENFIDFRNKKAIYIEYVDDFGKARNSPNRIQIPINVLGDNAKIFYDPAYTHVTLATDERLLEEIIDENVDKRIEPIQKEIYKLQNKINNILRLKEEKYYKE